MHDVVVLYNHPDDPTAFDAHYVDTHSTLVQRLPDLIEFVWGKPSSADSPYYVVARMTYADEAAAHASFASDAGTESVSDLENFAGAGVTVLHVPRAAADRTPGQTQ